MAEHTPGPWIIDAGETDEYVIREPRGKAVAVVCDSILGEDSPNANLIASAPELLEALKAITAICEDEDRFPIHTEIARKAIAKAESV